MCRLAARVAAGSRLTLLLLLATVADRHQDATAGRFLADSLGQDLFIKLVGRRIQRPPLVPAAVGRDLVASFSAVGSGGGTRVARAPDRRPKVSARLDRSGVGLAGTGPTKLPHYACRCTRRSPSLAAQPRRLAGLAPSQLDCLGGYCGTLPVRRHDAVLAAALIVLPLRFGDHLIIASVLGALVWSAWRLLRGVQRRPWSSHSAGFVLPAALAVVPVLDRL